ncbi:MAG: hypothetical protein GY832_43860, partial [Chloroflexi bacterium]|nr:hypothetical protein [Chloroflexota bacterium]
MPVMEIPEISDKTAQNMRKVNIRLFVAATKKWKRWRYDFEVAMRGAAIPRNHWVAAVASHLDDKARDLYEELTGARRGCQTIEWDELAEKFELRFQEVINPNNAMLKLRGMKFNRNKDDFADFSTNFYEMAAHAFPKFDSAALDVAASAELRHHLPQGWVNKLDEAHNKDSDRITFSYDRDLCQLLQNMERARSEGQRLTNDLKKEDGKPEAKKNVKGQPMFNTDTGAPDEAQGGGQRGRGRQKGNKGDPPSAFTRYMPDIGPEQMDRRQQPPFDNGGAHGRGNGPDPKCWNPMRGFRQPNGAPGRGGNQQSGTGRGGNTCRLCGREGHFARECYSNRTVPYNSTCRKCGQEGHWANSCTQPNVSGRGGYSRGGGNGGNGGGHGTQSYYPSQQQRRTPTCYRCGQLGHYANQCTNPRNSFQGGPSRNEAVENRCGICHQNMHLSINCPNQPPPQQQLWVASSAPVATTVATAAPAPLGP